MCGPVRWKVGGGRPNWVLDRGEGLCIDASGHAQTGSWCVSGDIGATGSIERVVNEALAAGDVSYSLENAH